MRESDKDALIREIFRVLKRGGRIAISGGYAAAKRYRPFQIGSRFWRNAVTPSIASDCPWAKS